MKKLLIGLTALACSGQVEITQPTKARPGIDITTNGYPQSVITITGWTNEVRVSPVDGVRAIITWTTNAVEVSRRTVDEIVTTSNRFAVVVYNGQTNLIQGEALGGSVTNYEVKQILIATNLPMYWQHPFLQITPASRSTTLEGYDSITPPKQP